MPTATQSSLVLLGQRVSTVQSQSVCSLSSRYVLSANNGPLALIYHGGGLIVGSSEMIPKVQVQYLANQAFVVVIPNYRLAPQVTAKKAFADCEEAYDWATTSLLHILKSEYDVEVECNKVVTMGHSSGGTIALHIASCKSVKAVTAFYPSLFNADTSTSAHRPTTAPPFGSFPDFLPSDEDWGAIKPSGKELSEAPLARPGVMPVARNKWQMHILKHGQWTSNILPDGDFAAIDPLTRLNERWPPAMIVQGEADNVPGSSLALAQRAEKEIEAAGVKEVQLELVPGEDHMFDMPPIVGTTDLGSRWEAVVRGLNWLKNHV